MTDKVCGPFPLLTLVLLKPDMPCPCNQSRSRSVGFWRKICTVCHISCEFISTTSIKKSNWLKIRSGCDIIIYSAWQRVTYAISTQIQLMGRYILKAPISTTADVTLKYFLVVSEKIRFDISCDSSARLVTSGNAFRWRCHINFKVLCSLKNNKINFSMSSAIKKLFGALKVNSLDWRCSLSMMGKIFCSWYFEIFFFSYFSQKLVFGISCKLYT